MKEDKLKNEKEVAYYSALVNAWINTKMERDKTLLILSSGGVGILVTLLSTIGASNIFGTIIYVLAFISFLCTMISLVIIFDKNSKHLEDVANGNKESDPKLALLDKISFYAFILGAIFSIIVAVNSAIYNQNKKGVDEMAKQNIIQSEKGKVLIKSLNGVGKISPKDLGDSVNGVGKISPKPTKETSKTTKKK